MINILVKVKNVMNKILSAASVVLLVFMTSLVLWQVFTRYVLGKPAAFTEELVKYSLMWTAFIGAAYAFFTRDHMSLTIIKDKLTGNKRKILLLRFDLSRCFSAKHYISENSVQNIRRADNPQRLRIIGSKVLFYL